MFMNRTDSILVNGFLFLGGILLAAIGNFLGSGNDWLLGALLTLMGLIPLSIRWFSGLLSSIRTFLSNYDSEEDQGQNT